MSNAHFWKRIWFLLLYMLLFIFPLIDSDDTNQLTSCERKSSRSLLFVSTLDGKISALDANNLGKKQWTLDLNGGPMLSSSIHRRELNDNGQWVRLIPSLRGGLYKFDGENLEAIPISAVQLLDSSFRYSDNLVFSGGREVKSYGVSSTTGKVLYECGINGCTNNTRGESYIEQDVLIIQRFQQTVRAVEPRTGIERWNFSVGQHNLVSVSNSNNYCRNKAEDQVLDIEIKVVIPDGLIWAINRNNPTVKLWQYKFDSPIITIWREDADKNDKHNNLKEINLFDSMPWFPETEFSTSPGIYLGMHDRQLYIQENAALHKSLEALPLYTQHSKYPWQPYPASVTTADIKALPGPENSNDDNDILPEVNDTQSTTALSVLYNSEYVNGNGFYLFSEDQLQLDNNKQCNRTNSNSTLAREEQKLITSNGTHSKDDETPVQVIIVSLWYWWKEVFIISITTAFLLNFVLTQRLLNATTVAKDAVLPPLIVERHIETNKNSPQISSDKENIDNFTSRYLTDFEPVDCLGKGGYGVVFEAKNKIDDCNYAIKRIALSNSQSSRERVMREVKALAKLDHQNIVRYFNAWLECPPAGWQEKHDPKWLNQLRLPTEFPSDATNVEMKVTDSVCINLSQTDQSSVESACEAYDALNHCDMDEDSYIVFEKSHSMGLYEDISGIDNCSNESSNVSYSNNVTNKMLSKIDNHIHSESIIFEHTDTRHSKKDENRKRQRSFSLDLNNKPNTRRSPKMFLYIQMQLCQRLSLRDWLKNQSMQDYRRVLNIFQQIVEAVEYVHLQGLIHRDLKPSNIFFSFDDKIKVGDFGLVTAMTEGYDEVRTPTQKENITLKNSSHTAYVGTHLYMSPEQMKGRGYNYKVDIYSLGIIFFELLIPFVTEMERITALLHLRKSVFPNNFDTDHPAEYDLLKMMLDENPNNRPTTLGIKARPPLKNYEIANGFCINEDSKWHFELPQLTRHSSVTNSSSGESWENIS
ncbi:eukaryotic translation initiation factor 2-alpha kinase [Hylaeus anthracinus]|uniref:eukaryotic translation initiation factor 2-alpha kinase n=1 Tax=Hylaeus anthracinus TaxID=313031 RepID=UPI0023B8CEF9|nr:eukaryotic translation initiation factor 2-alpha kinase [Hylaeus anthracinus]XP_054012154.1 eukaryotic translation initiation factor 2-alpha kinase [Hylaeus anthracinus]XP_054012155.1 eukaryotic translation initiation factor 2-alpha kinase [Hylaeus anthracinus]XP_054012156.1 eukaryotic translation initiation factor 2-alpha kinase [Hylaeus anthracinus]